MTNLRNCRRKNLQTKPASRMIPLLVLICFGAAFLTPARAQLEGVVDLHVHSAPDSGPRSVDAIEIARIARRHGVRALLLKNHYTHTASLAYTVSQVVRSIELYGGIALNRSVGGINPIAVEHMARTTGRLGRVVWMPTFDSEHYTHTLRPNPHHVPISRNGELLPEVKEVFAVMTRENLALATGHSSPEESLLLIRQAKRAGIEQVLVTHPMLPPVGMSVEQQKEAARLGAFLEYPSNAIVPMGEVTMEDLVKTLRTVGIGHAILSSDLGQPMNPIHTSGLLNYFERLKERGFTQNEIEQMAKDNPARFLGLD